MEASNCPRCGKLFTRIRSPICPACEKAEEQTFQVIKDYVEENPDCTMAELSTETKVSIKRIMQYLRDGRLKVSKGMAGDLRCDQCGKPIASGRYCETCAVQFSLNVNELFKKKREVNRMHTVDN